MKHIKQLNSLRALAMLTVIIIHWFPHDNLFYLFSEKVYAPNIFFTISGFLITSVLLKERMRADAAAINKGVIFKNFFLKRVLRLFPAYYLILCIVYFFPPAAEFISFKYFITFTSNIYIYKIQKWPALAHLWSMSVEEQFYIIWPVIILFAKRKFILPIIMAFIAAGIYSQHLTIHNHFSCVLTTNCFDSFGIGAILSWLLILKPADAAKYYKLISYFAAAVFCLLLIHFSIRRFYFINDQTIVSILAAWAIVFFYIKPDNKLYLFAFLFENNILIRIGKISYGMYLFHFILPYYTYKPFTYLNNFLYVVVKFQDSKYLWILENFCLLILISYFSYRYFETPFLRLKKYLKDPSMPAKASVVAGDRRRLESCLD